MCGIVSVLSVCSSDITSDLLSSLKRLEYRGYDSAGIAVIDINGNTETIKAVGRISSLEKEVVKYGCLEGVIGIGHTRWATHGGVSLINSHPHSYLDVSIVHNGIIENYDELKTILRKKGHVFQSETDSEVIAHWITEYMNKGNTFIESFKSTMSLLVGTYAIVAISEREPNILLGSKKGSPMAFGENKGKEKAYIASDAIALASLAENVAFLEDGDAVVLDKRDNVISCKVYDKNWNEVSREFHKNTTSYDEISKNEFEDFMRKEIFEGPKTAMETFLHVKDIQIGEYQRLCFIACGTSYYAGIAAKYWIEDLQGVPVDVEIASEFRYRNPVLSQNTLYVFISQSGETIDTLCALKLIKESGLKSMSIVNVDNSSIFREADLSIQTKAGPEMGVASTKAFIAQMMAIISVFIDRRKISVDSIISSLNSGLSKEISIKEAAAKMSCARQMLYIGRGSSYPIAMEGALKIKELSYIGAEGYPSGEMKHGPIALIDSSVYTIVIAPDDKYFEKTMLNAQEILSRNGKVIFITNDSCLERLVNVTKEGNVEGYISIEKTDNISNSFGMAVILHLLAYYTAKTKGLDVDKPRNLAKSVTVE